MRAGVLGLGLGSHSTRPFFELLAARAASLSFFSPVPIKSCSRHGSALRMYSKTFLPRSVWVASLLLSSCVSVRRGLIGLCGGSVRRQCDTYFRLRILMCSSAKAFGGPRFDGWNVLRKFFWRLAP